MTVAEHNDSDPLPLSEQCQNPENQDELSSPRQVSDAAERSRAAKLKERRFRWQWNLRLLAISSAVLACLLVVSLALYFYHSRVAASTFLTRADAAAESNDFAEQSKWLRRYSLLMPEDKEFVYKVAIAADSAVDVAPPQTLRGSLDNARKQLTDAIARLSDDEEVVTELRERLIKRLFQLGPFWYSEAERQVVKLNAPPDDPQAHRWLAVSLLGQVEAGIYRDTITDETALQADDESPQTDYWRRLSNLKVGECLLLALELNQEDLELIGGFLISLVNRPAIFEEDKRWTREQLILGLPPDEISREEKSDELARLADDYIARLAANFDSRSSVILYEYFTLAGRPEDAKRAVLRVATDAAGRLAALQQSEQSPPTPESGEMPDYYWDYRLLYQAARLMSTEEPETSAEWFGQLTSIDLPALPQLLAISACVDAGVVQMRLGDADRAMAIWEQGLQKINDESLDLLWSLAMARVRADDGEAVDAVARFRDAVSTQSSRLARSSASETTLAERTALSRRIDVSKWRLGVVEAEVAENSGDRMQAIALLEEASSAPVEVEPEERADAAIRLANLYQSEGLVDQAAAALDRAVTYAPDNERIRIMAATAWMQSGNRLQAIGQWRVAGTSDSLAIQIASVNAAFNYQLLLPPKDQDFSGVRSLVNNLIRKVPSTIESGSALEEAFRLLAILEISIPPRGMTGQEHLNSKSFAQKVRSLAEKSPGSAVIQAYAAERLAIAGLEDESKLALARLRSILGESATPVATVTARIDAAAGRYVEAASRLIRQAESDSERRSELLRQAADVALLSKNNELAYSAISTMPEEEMNLAIKFRLSQLARSLPADSKFLRTESGQISPLELSKQWEEKLKRIEGERGTYWRWLEATRIIADLYQDPNRIERNDPRVVRAKELVRTILSWRPRWGSAISLEGWLSAVVAKPLGSEDAVDQLRRGIGAGDDRLESRMLLIRQLIRLDRGDEAIEEVQLASRAMATDFDKFGEFRIAAARRRGDTEASIETAKQVVQDNPDDFYGYLVLASTILASAEQAKTAEDRLKRIDDARTALEDAENASDVDDGAIFAARTMIEVTEGNEKKIRKEIDRIEASSLDAYSKALYLSELHGAIREFDIALRYVQQMDSIKPSWRSQLAIARINRKLGQTDAEIDALRRAQEMNPTNGSLRTELAKALAIRDGKQVNWVEVGKLLSEDDAVTVENRLIYAILLVNQGTPEQRSRALEILRDLVREGNSLSDDASRFLVNLLLASLKELTGDETSAKRQDLISQCRDIYEILTVRGNPEVTDIHQYANFLLEYGTEDDLQKIGELENQLAAGNGGAMLWLDIRLRNQARIEGGQLPKDTAQLFIEKIAPNDEIPVDKAQAIAGAALLRLGDAEPGLGLLDDAYRQNPENLSGYVLTLRLSGETDKAIKLCTEHFKQHRDKDSAVLLAELLVAQSFKEVPREQSDLINQALKEFSNHTPLLEAVATLKLQQNDFSSAISLFERIDKIQPFRVRTLNNWAMALSEVQGRAAEGIVKIDSAIKLAGELPELLDTKGVVQYQAGRLEDAEKTFEKAILASDEPRYQFHLIMTYLAQDKQVLAKQKWNELDLDRLDPAGLTSSERELLESLKKEYGTPPPRQSQTSSSTVSSRHYAVRSEGILRVFTDQAGVLS